MAVKDKSYFKSSTQFVNMLSLLLLANASTYAAISPSFAPILNCSWGYLVDTKEVISKQGFQLVYCSKSNSVKYDESMNKWFQVGSHNMLPSLPKGSYVLIEPYINVAAIERGDIVVYIRQDQKGTLATFVSRIIAFPNDEILISGKNIIINNHEIDTLNLHEDTTFNYIEERHFIAKYIVAYSKNGKNNKGKVRIPEGHYFLMGDNRDNSNDSRYHGSVKFSEIVGKVTHGFIQATEEND
ncbi:MAG: signal peptidase I [Gammaproteobacteria bacterium]|nr:signal peptidase I [Gammaproteobacteria bacterium]